MRTPLPAVGAVLAAALAVTPAHAGAGSRHKGGCGVVTMTNDLSSDSHRGTITLLTALHSDGSDDPVSATVTCYLALDGAELGWTRVTASGTGVVAGAHAFTFTMTQMQRAALCTEVDFTSDDTPTSAACRDLGPLLPIDETPDEPPPFEYVDRNLCPHLASFEGTYGVVDVDEQGDVAIAGEPFWDCPPYEVTR